MGYDDEEKEFSETAFYRATCKPLKPLVDHVIKRAAQYISSVITAALLTAFATHQEHKAEKPAQDINSGTNWIGKSLLDAHNEIYADRAKIKDLQEIVSSLTNRLAEIERNKIKQ